MVDHLGEQDRGVPAGAEVTRDTFVVCARNGGLRMMLIDAQLSYLPYECNPNSFGNIGQCPHQKPCLELRLQMQQQATAGIPGHEQPPSLGKLGAALVTAAFQGLPTGNQQLR
jgi:hypothetical protein